MVQVTGTVHDVTGNPDRVERIVVRAEEPRMHGSTYVTEESAQFTVENGELDFEVLPGPCVVAFLRSHGATTYEKLLVPDKTSATLAECIEAADLATEGTQSSLERLALEIQAELGQVPSLVSEALAQDSTIIDAVKQVSAIKVDTTAGTAIYVGDTLIFGDTGTRALVTWDKEGNITYGTIPSGIAPAPDKSGGIYIRRVGQRVTWSIIGAVAAVNAPSAPIPNGFRVTHEPYPYTNLTPVKKSGPITANVGSAMLFLAGFSVGENMAHVSSSYGATAIWDCTQPWPETLPGNPA